MKESELSFKNRTKKQIEAMFQLEEMGYEIVAVDGRVVLEKGDNIIQVSKAKYEYEACFLQRYIIAEKIYNHLKTKKK